MHDSPTIIKIIKSEDERGNFSKVFSPEISQKNHILNNVVEIFSSNSSKYTLRGMHFQKPPYATGKLIWVTNGSILDYVIDVRRINTFGRVYQFTLSSYSGESLWVPPGFAHGFQALDDNSIVNYATDGIYNSGADVGIHWNSFGAKWANTPSNISHRDSNFPTLEEYRHQSVNA